MQFRLHIDIPLGHNEKDAIDVVKRIESKFHILLEEEKDRKFKVSYRLGHDEDRQKSNYLDKNENGHVSNKKTTLWIST